jgi:hypothetical protein
MVFNPGTDVFNQPLRDAWWTPGWTAQNQSYIPVPPSQFQEQGFPPGLIYVTVIGNYFDLDGNGNSGFLTFWPSSSLFITAGGGSTVLEQRFAGQNESFIGMNQLGNGKIFIWNGQLAVTLLATDQPNVTSMTPASFSYHVTENFIGGREYDITVPSADMANNTTGTDINSLIVPGSLVGQTLPNQTFPAFATENVVANVTELVGILVPPGSASIGNPTQYPVQFAFTTSQNQTPSSWNNGAWVTSSAPYITEILVGPANGGLVLAKGTYGIWVRVVTPTQVPAIEIGTLTLT